MFKTVEALHDNITNKGFYPLTHEQAVIGNDEVDLETKLKKINKDISKSVIDYSKEYFTIKALDDGTISFIISHGINTDLLTSISYSVNNSTTWITINNEDDKENNIQIDVNVSEGDKVLWKGNALALSDLSGGDNISSFVSDIQINVYGNIMSLLYGDDFTDKIALPNISCTFYELFGNDINAGANLVNAKNLILPATTLTSNCYHYMFDGCTSLTTAPELPATILANNCYIGMFNGCASLTSAPTLPATILAQSCYSRMFQGCTSLNYIKCLATDISATNCVTNWVVDVASSGTFIKADSMSSWTTGTNGIPTEWTVYTESEWKEVRHYELNTAISNITHPVTSVDGQTGAVTISHPVTSVNGQTGAVTIQPNVKANWATTDSTSESFIINKPHVTEIKELYYNDTTGLLATSAYSLTFTESLAGYDLVKCYFRATNKNLSDSNVIPPAILYIPLNEDSQLLSGEYSGSVTIPYVDNDNRYAAYRCLISSDKTQFRVVSQTSLYGTAGTNISNATHGIYCYRIEAINTGNLIVDNTQSSGSSFVESDPVFLASPAYNITSTDISNWNNKLDTAPVTSVNGQTGSVTIQGNIKPDWDATAGSDAEILNKPDLSNFLTIETQSNWNETNTSSAAYIQNKPTIVNSVNGMTGAVTINIPDVPVTSVNGMTGAVVIPEGGVTSFNGATGAITYNAPVTSVNGQTGAVSLTIPTTSTSVIANDNNPVSGGAVYNKFADLIGAAPAALDTLAEIANALNNDADLAGTLTTQISNKVPKVSNPTADNFASFNSDGTIKDSGHSHSDYITSIKTVNNESLVGSGNIVISGLPQVSSTDNGKILMVVNGQWQLVSPSVLYSGSGVPNNANGNNGDLYMQTD